MSIRWDSVLVRGVASELDTLLSGARLRSIRLDGSSRDLVMLFREHAILWRLHPTRGYVLRMDPFDPGPGDLPLPGKVRRVMAPPDERLIRFELLPVRSNHERRDLIVELMGNQWNAAVTEGPQSIVRHVLFTRTGGRHPTVGHPYTPPPAGGRDGIAGDLTREAWKASRGGSSTEEQARTLIRTVAWVSPINVSALLEEGGAGNGFELWRRIALDENTDAPSVLELPRGPQPYPIALPGPGSVRAGSLLDAFRLAAERTDEDEPAQVSSLAPELLRRLEEAIVQSTRKKARLERDLAGLPDPTPLRALGDLILAHYAAITPGAATVRLDDFTGDSVEVELDPSLPPNENASAYYRKAAKASRAAERLPGLIDRAAIELAELERLHAAVVAGSVDEAEVLRRLPERARRAQRGPDLPDVPYRLFRSSGGLEIRVGRGARHNDDLTFRHSAPGDVWLHARHAAGAHVILRWPNPGSPPARDLEEAAGLAALHSKARTSGSVPVDWTHRKYVRKPRGAPPGSVVPDRARTVFVSPEPELLERLAVEAPGADPTA